MNVEIYLQQKNTLDKPARLIIRLLFGFVLILYLSRLKENINKYRDGNAAGVSILRYLGRNLPRKNSFFLADFIKN